jgi:ankyrin repeat protein
MSSILQIVSLITILTINCFIPTKLLAQDCGAICDMDYWSELDAESDTMLQVLETLPSVDARHKYGWTVLSVAASYGHVEAVRILLKRGADPNIADDWGTTAVFAAVRSGSLDIVKMLVEAGANINHQNLKGEDAYSKALLRDEIEITNFLKNLLKVEGETVTKDTAKKTTHLPVGQLEMAFASDEVSTRLRSEIEKLEARNSELSKNLQILKTEVKNLESKIAVGRAEQETESQKELEQLRTEHHLLRK